jgi:Flp pilus assembly protein TadG
MPPAEAAAKNTRAALEQASLFRPFRFIPSRRQRRDAAPADAVVSTHAPLRFPWRLWRRAARVAGKEDRGVATIEFAVLAPTLLLLALVATDTVNLLRAQMRLDSTALQLGQLVSQCTRIVTPGDTDQFWSYADRIIGNLGEVVGSSPDGSVVISAVGLVGGVNRVQWQARTGSSSFASRVGAAGTNPTLPGGYLVPAGQTLFVTEVFLRRESWPLGSSFMNSSGPQTLAGMTMFLSRVADAASLQAAPASRTTPDCTA